MASLFDAAHSGDVAAVRARAAEGIDINAKDVNGRSALILAIEGGHDDVVSELLARGADRHEALAAGHGQSGSNIATLLNDAQLRSQHGAEGEHQQQHQQPPHHPMFGPIPTDIYGGYQLPDGSIAYGGYPQYPPPFQGGAPGQPTFYHDPVMFPHSGASMPPYPFPPMAGGGPRPRGSSSFGQASQGRKPSTVGKLPPPEIAKTIPCRFYPNCRNGASCIFAHVDGNVMPDASPSVTSPSHAPHHPHDGGAPPPPPGYYGLPPFPPHFYMMPHGNGANGAGPMAGMPFSGPSGAPMPLHYQPHEAPHPGQMTPVAPVAEDALPTAAAPAAPESEQAAAADEASAQQSAPAPVPQEEGKGGPAEEAAAATDAAGDDLDRRRRQSFNSFLHSHAVPFQPAHVGSSVNGAAVPIPLGPAAASMHGYGHGQGGFNGRGKLRGRGGGAAGMMGRSKHERSPCTFFARNACKYGSECLFPHILPDGSDARRLPGTLQPRHGQQIQHVDGAGPSSSVAPVNGDAPPKTGNTPRQPAAASVPLGPKLKREAGLPPTPSVEVTSSAAQAQESGASKDSKKVQAQAQSQSNGVVPSKPSATAMAGAAAAAAAATSVPATSSSSSSSQAQPQGQSQQQPSQPQQQQQQQQQPARKANAAKVNGVQNNKKAPIAPAQRMPSGADFPALPGSPNTSAGVASQNPPSPAVSTPAQPSQQASSPEASNAAPASTSAPPKVNFSAILSAPAPPKKAVIAAPTTTTTTESSPAAAPAETNGDVEVTDKVDEQTSSSAAPVKEKASSGKPNKQNSAASGGKAWGQQRPQHHHAHPQQQLASSKEPILDADDFQLVKGRNHGKRATGSSRSGGASSSFAAATKAAVTA